MEPFIGEIRLFAGNYAPVGWAFCNGQSMSVRQNSALYALIGNLYGGDQVNFNLPDLRGRAALHQGSGPGLTTHKVGDKGGLNVTALTAANLPAHKHVPNCCTTDANLNTPDGNIWANSPERGGVNVYQGAVNTNMNTEAIGPAGGSNPHDNMQPYLGLNFIIAVQGIFPVRP